MLARAFMTVIISYNTMAKCVSPIQKEGYPPLPCGGCLPCKMRRASNWSVRLCHEAERSTSAFFLTLTYDTENVPISPNGFMTLRTSDFQTFMKALRKRHPKGTKIKYYCVGEYGSDRSRPHWHVIIYNMRLDIFLGKKLAAYHISGRIKMNGKTQVQSEVWKKGVVSVGQVNEKSAGYCLQYISCDSVVGKHDRDDRQKEYALMSKGLGKWYTEADKQWNWHHADLLRRMYISVDGGKKAPMPRYYRDRIYTVDELDLIKEYLSAKEFEEKFGENYEVAKKRRYIEDHLRGKARKLKKSSI